MKVRTMPLYLANAIANTASFRSVFNVAECFGKDLSMEVGLYEPTSSAAKELLMSRVPEFPKSIILSTSTEFDHTSFIVDGVRYPSILLENVNGMYSDIELLEAIRSAYGMSLLEEEAKLFFQDETVTSSIDAVWNSGYWSDRHRCYKFNDGTPITSDSHTIVVIGAVETPLGERSDFYESEAEIEHELYLHNGSKLIVHEYQSSMVVGRDTNNIVFLTHAGQRRSVPHNLIMNWFPVSHKNAASRKLADKEKPYVLNLEALKNSKCFDEYAKLSGETITHIFNLLQGA